MKKEIITFMEPHLGDNIYFLDYLRKIVDANPKYSFTHYAHSYYMDELQNHIKGYENSIKLIPFEYVHDEKLRTSYIINLPKDAIHGWINVDEWFEGFYVPNKRKNREYPIKMDKMYIDFYDYLEQKHNLPNPIKTSDDFLLRMEELNNYNLPKEYDVLIINSVPQSAQYVYEEKLFHDIAHHFQNQGYKVISTREIQDIECTLHYRYNLVDIAKISTKTPIIIAVNTGPLALCLNKITMDNVQFFHVLDVRNSFSYDKITHSHTLKTLEF
jgi:hypothetical protein